MSSPIRRHLWVPPRKSHTELLYSLTEKQEGFLQPLLISEWSRASTALFCIRILIAEFSLPFLLEDFYLFIWALVLRGTVDHHANPFLSGLQEYLRTSDSAPFPALYPPTYTPSTHLENVKSVSTFFQSIFTKKHVLCACESLYLNKLKTVSFP